MKSTLFLLILLLGSNCIAQNTRQAIQSRNSFFNSKVNSNNLTGNEIQVPGRSHFSLKRQISLPHVYSKLESPTQLLDSVYMWSWDTTNMDWALDYKYSVTEYDVNNNVLSELGEIWDGSAWVNSDKSFYSYYERNNVLSYEWLLWNGTDWENGQKGSYEYDANNNMLSEWIQDGYGSDWVGGMMLKKTYDLNNNMLSYLHQNWNGTEWENYFRHIYTYDDNNNMTSDLRQAWTGDKWEDSWQNTYEYDVNNNLIHEINYVDNGAELVTTATTYYYDASNKLVSDSTHTWGNSWEYDIQGIYTYDLNGNLLTSLYQSRSGDNLENLSRNLYTYDDANNQTSIFYQYWMNNNWVNSGLDESVFDEYNFLTNSTLREWNSSGTLLLFGDSTSYYYHAVNTGINEIGRSKSTLTVYPNPSFGVFNVESPNTINSFEIYNSFGQRIYHESGLNRQMKKEINISNYGNGVYLLKIQTNSGIETKKLLIQ